MALFDLYGRGLAVITDHLGPLHSTPFHCRNADDAPGIITGEATPTGTGHPHHQARPNSRQSERTCRARQSVRPPAPLTTPPHTRCPPLAHLEFDLHGAVEGQDLELMVRLAAEHVEM